MSNLLHEATEEDPKAAAALMPGVNAVVTTPMPEVGLHTPPQRHTRAGHLIFPDAPEFKPVLSPEQVIRLGSFGGTYWRPIVSAVTGERYAEPHREFPEPWFKGVGSCQLSRAWRSYSASANRYGVKCGGDLHMWESSGWMSNLDPYGWFQWYCRFYCGRRSTDDARQISRWLKSAGPSGRFRNQLIGKCARAGTSYDDARVSPVIRQSLQHWAYQLSSSDAEVYTRKKGLGHLKPGAPAVHFETLALPATATSASASASAPAAKPKRKQKCGATVKTKKCGAAVVELRRRLDAAMAASPVDVAAATDLLAQLHAVPMTLDLLQSSLVGKSVNKVRKAGGGTAKLKESAKALVAKWKAVAQ